MSNNKKIFSGLFLLLLVIGVPVTVYLAQQSQDTRNHAAGNETAYNEDFSVVITPKMISDFDNPLPSIQQFYDSYETTMKKFSQQLIVLYVGSGDHIYSYPQNAFAPPNQQAWNILGGTVPAGGFNPPDPCCFNGGTANIITDGNALNGQPTFAISLPNGSRQVMKSNLLPDNQGISLKQYPIVSWYWRKPDGDTIAIQFQLHRKNSSEYRWVGYYAGQKPADATTTAWAQFSLGSLPTAWRQESVNLNSDVAFSSWTWDINGIHQIEQQEWEIIGFALTPYNGSAGYYYLINANQGNPINWARFCDHCINFATNTELFNQKGRAYPQDLTYAQLKNIYAQFRAEGQRRGLNVKLFDGVDSAQEFSLQPWKYYKHPESLLSYQIDNYTAIDMNWEATLQSDPTPYASGNPGGRPVWDFIADQIGHYVNDMGLDGIYSTNGYGTKAFRNYQYSQSAPPGHIKAFWQKIKQAMGAGKYHFWMDSYFPVDINQTYLNIPLDAYQYLDFIETSTFYQDGSGLPVAPCAPNGWLKCPRSFTMQDVVTSETNLRATYPQTKVFYTLYYNDPWYPEGLLWQNGQQTGSMNLGGWNTLKGQLNGVTVFSNDYKGNNIPASTLQPLADSITYVNDPAPMGNLDTVSCQTFEGWACDGSNFSTPVQVHFYDGSDFSKFIGATTTSTSRPDVAAAGVCGGNGTVGFSFTVPDSLKDGQAHQIYAYAINNPTSGTNPLLGNAPKPLQCSAPPPPQPTFSPLDLNQDGHVDIKDLLIVISQFGQSGQVSDINHDGVVNIFDFNMVVGGYGK